MIYLRNADLHEALGRTAAAAELDYLDKLLKTGAGDRSRYARLHLAEALLARGNAAEARRHFEQVRADPGIERRYQAIAGVGLGSVLWAQRDAKGARGVWAGAGGAAEIALARAAAQGSAQLVDVKSLRRVADDASLAPELSPRTRRYLIEIYTATGAPDKALATVRAADLGMASFVERFNAAKGTAKSINLYDLALLTDLTRLYRELARRQLEQAAADARMKPSAEYYLGEVLSGLGASDQAQTYVQAFLARPQAPAQYRERALARQALIAHRQGRRAEAESAWTAMAGSSDPEVLADIVLGCADVQAQCAKVLARVGQVTEAGDGRRYQRLNFALGSYYLRKKDYARAISHMEAGRDKSNKNKIEANDPEMLAGLAEAYYRTKKFSEGLEIFFEMSKEFPVVRQIQEAMQGVYSMEQRSAGDVKIL
jgi:tetratricopeptide (TPR) repeat protein